MAYYNEGELRQSRFTLRNIIVFAILMRVICLVIVLLFFQSNGNGPYFIVDDVAYEAHARFYIQNASSVIDPSVFKRIPGIGLDYPFWSWVVCILAYITKNIYACRFLNIALSAMCILWIYKLALNIAHNANTALKAAKLYAFLPLPVLLSCFCIKDIFLTFACLTFFNLLLKVENKERLTIKEIILEIILAVCVNYTRGAVIGLFIIFLLFYWIKTAASNGKIRHIIFALLGAIVLVVVFRQYILDSFMEKLFWYGNVDGKATTVASFLTQILSEITIIPVHYFSATISPFALPVFTWNKDASFWLNIICFMNISMIPIAVGNIEYIFVKKERFSFWLFSIIMYCSVVILSFGIFRHFLFLLPIEMINYACFINGGEHRGSKVFLGTAIVFVGMVVFSVLA